MTHLARDQSPARSHTPTRLLLVQHPSIILGLEKRTPISYHTRLTQTHGRRNDNLPSPVNDTWTSDETVSCRSQSGSSMFWSDIPAMLWDTQSSSGRSGRPPTSTADTHIKDCAARINTRFSRCAFIPSRCSTFHGACSLTNPDPTANRRVHRSGLTRIRLSALTNTYWRHALTTDCCSEGHPVPIHHEISAFH